MPAVRSGEYTRATADALMSKDAQPQEDKLDMGPSLVSLDAFLSEDIKAPLPSRGFSGGSSSSSTNNRRNSDAKKKELEEKC